MNTVTYPQPLNTRYNRETVCVLRGRRMSLHGIDVIVHHLEIEWRDE